MISINTICDSITKFLEKYRTPVKQLPTALMMCSLPKRPGLSTIYSVSNIIKDLNKLGIPTGPMPDGTPNLTVAFVYASTKETYRALKKDMVVQVGATPGSIAFRGFGQNAGGPIVINGFNVNFVNFPDIGGVPR